MICYLTQDHDRPSGGIQTQARHVELLVASGRDACLLKPTPTPFAWFDTTAPIRAAATTPLNARRDLLVIPEIYGPETGRLAGDTPKLVFAQNVHYMFRGYGVPPPGISPYRDPTVLGTMVLTDYERVHVSWAFPDHRVWTVRHGIDPAVFSPPKCACDPYGFTHEIGCTGKKKQIVFMPRKHADEAEAVFGWLAARGALDGWEVVALDGQSQAQVAQTLRESLMFFAFGYPEGGTLPPFEALMSGCIVVGYGGFASDSDIVRCGGWLVNAGNSCEFARKADEALRKQLYTLEAWGRNNAFHTRRRFSMNDERDALLQVMADVGH